MLYKAGCNAAAIVLPCAAVSKQLAAWYSPTQPHVVMHQHATYLQTVLTHTHVAQQDGLSTCVFAPLWWGWPARHTPTHGWQTADDAPPAPIRYHKIDITIWQVTSWTSMCTT